jgi:aspartate-semialdehyde dehydrogenase
VSHRIALSHASDIVAEAILEKLPESGISPDSLVLLDHESNVGKRIAYAGKHRGLVDQLQYDLSDCSLLLMTQADAELEAAALQQGCLLISHAIAGEHPLVFIAANSDEPTLAYSASCLRLPCAEVACLLPTLIELDRLAAIAALHITLLRSAEFHGKAGIDELASQTVNLLNARAVEARIFPQQIAFNLLPQVTDETIAADIRQYLGNSSCSLALQSVNVPLFHGFAAAIQLEFTEEADLEACQRCLSRLDNVTLTSSGSSPISDCNQSFSCVLSLLEQTSDQPSNLQFWMIADPMRYGLANNYVNVLDFLLKSFL